MARSIVLRHAANCFDCGAFLSVGTTARWFGKGRVSCCGTRNGYPTPDRTHPADDAAKLPPLPARLAELARHASIPPYLPSPELAELAGRTGIDVAALASGLNSTQVATLAGSAPNQRLLVRLSSGARLIVPAVHCAHVIRCIEESCVDRCRDVALLADKFEGGQ